MEIDVKFKVPYPPLPPMIQTILEAYSRGRAKKRQNIEGIVWKKEYKEKGDFAVSRFLEAFQRWIEQYTPL